MSLREGLALAFARLRTHPELFVLGGALGVAQTVAYVATAALVAATVPVRGFATVAPFVSLVPVLPLFVALYELALHPAPGESAVASLRRATATAARKYPRVILTDLGVTAVSFGGGALVAAGWYVVATGGRYARYVAGDPGAPAAFETVYLLGAAFVLGTLTTNVAFRFADVETAFHERRPVAAVAASVELARRNRLPIAGLAALLTVMQLLSLGVVASANEVLTTAGQTATASLGVLLAAVIVDGVAVTLTGVVHATFVESHRSANPRPRTASMRAVAGSWSRGQWTLAILLVLATVGGAVAVRTADAGVYDAPDRGRIATDDPDAALQAAVSNTARSNHRRVLYVRNASDPNSSFRAFRRSAVDYRDRQLSVYFHKPDGVRFGGFYGEGTLAMLRSGGRASGPLAYEAGNWSVLMVPATGLTGGGEELESSFVPAGPSSGWSVVSSNESTLVLRVTEADAIQDALGERTLAGETEPLAAESRVTVVVDRDRGVVERARIHLHSLETGRNVRYRLVYRDVGSADLRRPEPIRERRPPEWVWDAMYY
ncbi:MAG: hypothetical protein ABEJ74_00305 [Haloferacaceae archaeon]